MRPDRLEGILSDHASVQISGASPPARAAGSGRSVPVPAAVPAQATVRGKAAVRVRAAVAAWPSTVLNVSWTPACAAGAAGFSRLCARPGDERVAPSCGRPAVRTAGATQLNGGAQQTWPDVQARRSTPLDAPLASTRTSLHATDATIDASLVATLESRLPRCASCAALRSTAATAASRRRDAPSRARSRSPAWSIAPRACPPARDESPRARTRRPASSAPCLIASLGVHSPLWPSQA